MMPNNDKKSESIENEWFFFHLIHEIRNLLWFNNSDSWMFVYFTLNVYLMVVLFSFIRIDKLDSLM